MPQKTSEKLIKEKQKGREVQFLRMDNAGESKALETLINETDNSLAAQIEHTARSTPQQNSPMEQAFKTTHGKAKALFSAANVPMKTRCMLFPHWIKTVSKLDNLCVVEFNRQKRADMSA